MVKCGLKVHVVKCGEVWFKSVCGEVWCVVLILKERLGQPECGDVWCVVRQPEAAHQHLELASDLRLSGFGHRAVFALLGSFLLQVFAQEAAS